MAKDASTYHPVPSVRRFREREAAKGHDGHHSAGFSSQTNPHGHGLEQQHGPVTKTEVEKHEDGTAHVVAHHKDGHVQAHQHPNVAAAHAHARNLMAGAGGGAYAHEQHGNEQEAAKQGAEEAVPNSGLEDQDVLAESGKEGESPELEAEEHEMGPGEDCPNCGHKMEGGKCPQCGYEHGHGEEEGGGSEEG